MNTEPKRIKSKHALLDVETGRHTLFRRVGYTPTGTDYPNKVPVTITGFIVGAWGQDDGTSREFQVDVTAVRIGDLRAVTEAGE